MDNGPEYVSGKLMAWAEKAGIHILYIQPGKPQQNAYLNVTTAQSATNGPSHSLLHNQLPVNGIKTSLKRLRRSGTSHKLALDIQQRPAQHGHRQNYTRRETETSGAIRQADPIKNGGIAQKSAFRSEISPQSISSSRMITSCHAIIFNVFNFA